MGRAEIELNKLCNLSVIIFFPGRRMKIETGDKENCIWLVTEFDFCEWKTPKIRNQFCKTKNYLKTYFFLISNWENSTSFTKCLHKMKSFSSFIDFSFSTALSRSYKLDILRLFLLFYLTRKFIASHFLFFFLLFMNPVCYEFHKLLSSSSSS